MPKIHRIFPAALPVLIVLLAPDRALAAPNVCTLHLTGPCPGGNCVLSADVNGDGVVDAEDLGMVVRDWGTAASGTTADVNHDGVVGCFDRAFVLGNWGLCAEAGADLTGDGVVDCRDVKALLTGYGNCFVDANQNGKWDAGDPSFDVDNSGLVTWHDVALVACLFGPAGTAYLNVDFNGDGRVDVEDQQIVAAHLNQKCPFDLDQDGGVGMSDIQVLMEKWGGLQ